MSSTLPLPPKPDFEALPSRPPPERRQRSPRRSPPPRSRPSHSDSYHPDYRSRYRDTRGSSRYDSDGRGRDDYRRDDRRQDSRHYEPDRRDYDRRRDRDRDRSRDNDNGRDGRGSIRDRDRDRAYDRGRDYEKRDYDRDRRRYSPPRRRSRSRRRDSRSRSPRRRSSSRDRRWRSPSPPPRRSSPRRRSPDARSTTGVRADTSFSSRLSAPPEPKSSPRPDSATDVRRPQHGASQSPASPQRPPSTKVCPSPTPASSTLVDKGKAKVTLQSTAAFINEDVKMVDLAPPHSPRSIDQPRKPSPQPPVGGHLSPHPGLPTNSKRSRTSQSQTNAPVPNTSRLSPNFRLPPIPPHEVKEVVKENLNKEISRLASLNVSQKAAAEPLTRVAERSRHELEMSLLELYAAGERRKAAAAQVEEARAGTLGIGSGLEYSAKVSYS